MRCVQSLAADIVLGSATFTTPVSPSPHIKAKVAVGGINPDAFSRRTALAGAVSALPEAICLSLPLKSSLAVHRVILTSIGNFPPLLRSCHFIYSPAPRLTIASIVVVPQDGPSYWTQPRCDQKPPGKRTSTASLRKPPEYLSAWSMAARIVSENSIIPYFIIGPE